MPTDEQWERAIELRDQDIKKLRDGLTKALDGWQATLDEYCESNLTRAPKDRLIGELRANLLNAGWKKKLLSWDWHKLSLDGCPDGTWTTITRRS